ncbi:MAG: 16S rRNA (adenine(1518)-N(6)/adenine(1519)-N(6))-dimethyltransferase RsmA [Candidatus Aenigmatarchaeota archaeon]
MRFSQVFLKDKFYIQKIIQALEISENDVFLEVGPGEGIITEEILKKCSTLIAIEIDYILVKHLKAKFSDFLGRKFFIIHDDFLKIDLNQFDFEKFRFFSNLPYHITHNALFKILENKQKFIDIHIMLQKEVSDKILREKNYFHFLLNYYFEIKELFKIPPFAFSPRPKVFSSFLRFIPKQTNFDLDFEKKLFNIIKLAFLHKRKKLKNVIRGILKEYENKRAQELDFEDFIKIALNYK